MKLLCQRTFQIPTIESRGDEVESYTVIKTAAFYKAFCVFLYTLLQSSEHTRRQVAATNHSVCTGSNLLRRDRSLPAYWRIIVKILSLQLQQNFAPQRVAQILFDLISCDILLRQNSVAETKILTKISQNPRGNLSLRRVAATCYCNLSPNAGTDLNCRCYLNRKNILLSGPEHPM